MKQDITQTALWQEFLKWMKIIINKPTPETQIFSIEIMPLIFIKNETNGNSLLLRYGALIGLLEQFLLYKGIYLHQSVINNDEDLEFTYTVCYLRTQIPDENLVTGYYETPLLAKQSAIYQYFKSKG